LRGALTHVVPWNDKINFWGPRNSFTVSEYWYGVLFATFRPQPFILCAQVIVSHCYWKLAFSVWFLNQFALVIWWIHGYLFCAELF
jgi:hypothetical protein